VYSFRSFFLHPLYNKRKVAAILHIDLGLTPIVPAVIDSNGRLGGQGFDDFLLMHLVVQDPAQSFSYELQINLVDFENI
jgi:hypothetical protein